MNAPTAPLLSMEKMTKRFGGLIAVDKLDLEVREGTIHSIIGPNGAGKTTVFNCIMEFYTPDEGAIWFAGERIDGVTPDRVAEAGISRTYQNIRLFRNLTAMENILVGMHIHLSSTWYGAVFNTRATRRDEADAHDQARRILEFVGLRGRGLMSDPRVMLLDEPSMGLAPILVQKIFDTIVEIRKQGVAVLLVEQNAFLSLQIADYGYVIETGEIVLEGPGADLLNNSQVKEAYLG